VEEYLMKLPFSLGVTSLTFPEKGLLYNVKHMPAGYDTLEITMEYPRTLPIPEHEMESILDLVDKRELSITIHLPLSVELTSPNSLVRKASLQTLELAFRNAERLNPKAYVLHVAPFYKTGGTPLGRVYETILHQERVDAGWTSLRQLREIMDPQKIAVENLFHSLAYEEAMIYELGYGICMDVGHLLLDKADPYLHYHKHKERIKVIHLHDVVGGRDHQQLGVGESNLDIAALLMLIKSSGYDQTIILEQFKPEHLAQSKRVLEEAWNSII